MHIVYGVNEAFMPILAVSLSSLLLHAEGEALHFHILSLGIEEESKEKLRQYVETEGQKISFYDLEEKLFQTGFLSVKSRVIYSAEELFLGNHAELFLSSAQKT